ncbi:hypothetical protein [Mycobacterium sp. AZCC_0083]|uniref:hypothetical protein n=1 Tax=Mycobacterium sp. AZCC_0083 TaxID=2735882 RepID=UPI001607CBDE|nr:hypothetical protein [Mycobacterium sp. AZCC_0083]MBB5168262.1 hypothetical protein [Mycobacterium sp. AZCC_0083]
MTDEDDSDSTTSVNSIEATTQSPSQKDDSSAKQGQPALIVPANASQFFLSIGIFFGVLWVTQSFYQQLTHPSEMQGHERLTAGVLVGMVIGLAVVSLAAALVTFGIRDTSVPAKKLHEALTERVAFALIVASLIAIYAIYRGIERANGSVDVVDVIARLTATITIVAIATCAWLAYKAIWLTFRRLRAGWRGNTLAVALGVAVTGVAFQMGFAIGRLIATGNGFGRT